ncbi:MAG: phosphotransferase family protein [Fimbriimonas sp.]
MERELVQAIARSLGRDGGDTREIVGKGSVNRVFVADDLVVRLNHDRSPESALAEYQKERWCSEQAGQVIRVPKVLDLDMRDGRAYTVSEIIAGVSSDERPEISWPILGRLLRAVHEIDGPADEAERQELFGESRTPGEHWEWQRELNTASLGSDDPLCRLGVYAAPELPVIRNAFERLREVRFQFGLCHGDVTPRNLILADDGEPALIDWGCASIEAVPASDLVQIRMLHLLQGKPSEAEWEAFVAAYGPRAGDVLPLLPALLVLKSFDLVRWAVDRCPARVEEMVIKARKLKAQIANP